VDVAEAQALAQRGVTVVDVREPSEWANGHIAGARLLPLSTLRTVAVDKVLPKRKVLFVCAAGVRSRLAARLAAESGVREIYNLVGGTSAWSKRGLPLVRELEVAV
jgi:rhodanese-related sulfurtransferase